MNTKLKNIILAPMNLIYKINPKLELELMFYIKNGYRLVWDNPTTYNAKIQWIKLYDKNELMPICTDKYSVREFVKKCGCGEILNELYWQGFDAQEIPFDKLPNQFVIKVTHGSGYNIICKNKELLNRTKVIKQLNKWLKEKFMPCYGEWFYGVVRPRIIIEKFLSNDNCTLPVDYKVMCFNGEPRYIAVYSGRFNKVRRNFYDLDWNHLDVEGGTKNNKEYDLKPDKLNELLEYARILSKYFNHARVDFYIIDRKIYFGEITFTTGAGFNRIKPYSFDVEMGDWLKLPLGGN